VHVVHVPEEEDHEGEQSLYPWMISARSGEFREEPHGELLAQSMNPVIEMRIVPAPLPVLELLLVPYFPKRGYSLAIPR